MDMFCQYVRTVLEESKIKIQGKTRTKKLSRDQKTIGDFENRSLNKNTKNQTFSRRDGETSRHRFSGEARLDEMITPNIPKRI